MKKLALALIVACTVPVAQAEDCRTITYHAAVLDVEDLHQDIVMPNTATHCDNGQCATSVTSYSTFSTAPRFQVTIDVKGNTASFESPVEPDGPTVPVHLRECGHRKASSHASTTVSGS